MKNLTIPQNDRTIWLQDPLTKEQIKVKRTIVKTNKPTDAFFNFGEIKWKTNEDGNLYMDFSGLTDLDPLTKEFPEGMEVILLNCSMDYDFLPVKFNHQGIGNYSEVWIRKEDLDLVEGNLGTKIKNDDPNI